MKKLLFGGALIANNVRGRYVGKQLAAKMVKIFIKKQVFVKFFLI
jgi:hypothetical protein